MRDRLEKAISATFCDGEDLKASSSVQKYVVVYGLGFRVRVHCSFFFLVCVCVCVCVCVLLFFGYSRLGLWGWAFRVQGLASYHPIPIDPEKRQIYPQPPTPLLNSKTERLLIAPRLCVVHWCSYISLVLRLWISGLDVEVSGQGREGCGFRV